MPKDDIILSWDTAALMLALMAELTRSYRLSSGEAAMAGELSRRIATAMADRINNAD